MTRRTPLLLVAMLAFGRPSPAVEPKARSFAGHNGAVNAVSVSPDGKLVASTGADGTVRIWDVPKGRELHQLAVPSASWSVAFSPDGKTVAFPAQDNTVRIFDVKTGNPVRACEGHTGIIWAVAWSPDGKTLASTSADNTIRIWDAAKGKEERQLTGPAGPWPVEFSADGRSLVVGFDNGAVRLWDTRTWRQERDWEADKGGSLWPIALSPDGRTVATVRWRDGTVRIWETATGEFRDSTDDAGGGGGWAIGFAGDGCTLCAVGPGSLTLWDVWSGKKTTIRTATALHSVACSANGRTLAAGDANGTVFVWDVNELRKELRANAMKLSAEQLDEHWAALAEAAGERSFRAVRALASSPEDALPALRERLKPKKTEPVDQDAIAKLVTKLDDDDFETREKASAELEKLGPKIAAILRATVAKTKSAEVRKRLQGLLETWDKMPLTAEDLRALRAVEVLEAMRTPEARQVLKGLAEGDVDSVLTRAVKAALVRMER